jgi:hypothetical protein
MRMVLGKIGAGFLGLAIATFAVITIMQPG